MTKNSQKLYYFAQSFVFTDIPTFSMRAITLVFLLLFSLQIKAQTFDSSYVYTIIEGKTDTLSAVFRWVTDNISYNEQAINRSYRTTDTKKIVKDVWETKSGVCIHYAELLNAFYTKLGIQSYTIKGYAIDKGEENTALAHAWNMVKWKGKWYGMDATWASSSQDAATGMIISHYDSQWFKANPDSFVYSHVPYDPVWQMRFLPLQKTEIKEHKTASLQDSLFFEKEIESWNRLDSIEKQENTLKRMQTFHDDNPLYKKEMDKMQEIINIYKKNVLVYKHNQEVLQLNQLSDEFNLIIDLQNKMVAWYNSHFVYPKWSDAELAENMLKLSEKQRNFEQKLTNFKPEDPEIIRLHQNFNQNVQKLKSDVEKFDRFVKKYIESSKISRAYLRL